jgi:CHAT domain-containing protein
MEVAELHHERGIKLECIGNGYPALFHHTPSSADHTMMNLSTRRKWVLVVVLAGALLPVAKYYHFRIAGSPPAELLERAYRERRTVELRIGNAQRVPFGQSRGPGTIESDRPLSWLIAETRISQELERHSNDCGWLSARARMELLEWDYDRSMENLKRVNELCGESTDASIDMATGHYERAEALGHTLEYGKAIEELSEVLERDPDNQVGLFNRAMLFEKLFLYRHAKADWERMLKSALANDWAAEARNHLKVVSDHIVAQEGVAHDGDLTASTFLKHSASGDHQHSQGADEGIETYLPVALKEWLPGAFPLRGRATSDSGTYLRALRALGSAMNDFHHDRWLTDLLAASHTSDFPSAIEALSSAVIAAEKGDPTIAKGHAKTAEKLFTNDHNMAGLIRAQWEELYASQRGQHGDQCVTRAQALERRAQQQSYTWIFTQAVITDAMCKNMIGRLGEAESAVSQIIKNTQATGYRVLYLRALSLPSFFADDRGDISGSWHSDKTGLEAYWAGSLSPPLRSFQFYDDLSYAAEKVGFLHVAMATEMEAVDNISLAGNLPTEAEVRFRLGTLEEAVRDSRAAQKEYNRASTIFNELPQTEAIRTYQIDTKIALARIQTVIGDWQTALETLATVRPELNRIANLTLSMNFYQALAEADVKGGLTTDAERSFESCILAAEKALRSLRSDQDRQKWADTAAAPYRGLVEIRLHENRTAEALELWEWFRGAGTRKVDKIDPLTDVASTHTSLAFLPSQVPLIESSLTTQTVVSYAVLRRGIAIWEFDNRGLHFAWTDVPRNQLEDTIARFSRLCSDPNSDLIDLQNTGQELYKWFIQPISAHLEAARSLIVEPDDVIEQVPFLAVVDPMGEYLGGRFQIAISPGALFMHIADRPDRLRRALVFGAPMVPESIAQDFPPLPDALGEARTVASSFRNSTLVTGRQATLQQLQHLLPKCDVFHFAGHSYSGRAGNGLVLASSSSATPSLSLFRASDFRPGNLGKCHLAVLSACSTELGSDGHIADPSSLVRPFLLAGVPHVVATRWNVDSAATSSFMKTFYGAIAEGNSVGEAFHEAGREMREDPTRKHPFYWAAFDLFGRN